MGVHSGPRMVIVDGLLPPDEQFIAPLRNIFFENFIPKIIANAAITSALFCMPCAVDVFRFDVVYVNCLNDHLYVAIDHRSRVAVHYVKSRQSSY